MHARPTLQSALFTLLLSASLILAGSWPVMAAPVHTPPLQITDQAAVGERVAGIRSEAPDIEDDFAVDNGTWDIGYAGDTSIYFRAGMLHLAVDVENTVAWGESSTRAGDFYMEVDTLHREGALNNQFGVIFHLVDSDNFLFFAVGSDGYYSLQKLVDDEWEMLIPWTESDVVETSDGSENTLGVLAEGSTLTLLVNDYIIDQVQGIEPLEGKLALAAGSYDEPGVVVAFDNFAVWLLGGEAAGPRSGRPIRVPERPDVTPTPQPVEENDDPVTPEPDPTSEPSPEPPLPDGDLDARIAAIRAEIPLFTDDFSEDASGWEPNLFDGMDYAIDFGELQIEVSSPDSLGWAIQDQRHDNFYLEVDATFLDGSSIEEHGLLFHYVDPQNFYFFALSDTGEFSLWRLAENEWQAIQDWTQTPALYAGNSIPNRMGLLVEGEQFSLLINDQMVLEVEDDSFPTGAFGLAVGTFAEPGARVAFDNFTIWGVEASADSLAVPDALVLPTPEAGEETPVDTSEAAVYIGEIMAVDPTFDDDFRRDQGNWAMAPSDDSDVFFDRRALHLEVTSADWIGWSAFLGGSEEPLSLSDFYAEVDISFVQRPEGAAAGLVFRLQDTDNFYLYAVDANGSYSLQKKVGGAWVELIPWTVSDLIDSGEEAVNRAGVLAEGSEFVLTLNGEVVGEAADADLDTGSVALMAASGAVAGVEVSFDNFTLWDFALWDLPQ